MDLYLFDFDTTLYVYDFRKRLPEPARVHARHSTAPELLDDAISTFSERKP